MVRMWVYYAVVPGSRNGGEDEGCWDGREEGSEKVVGGEYYGTVMVLGGVSPPTAGGCVFADDN